MNKRNTIQRSLVFDAVKELHCHAPANEIYEHVIKNHPNVSRGTIYRNLNLLSDMGEIRKVEIPNSADCYDHQCHDHYHLQCIKCGRVFDVDMDFILDLDLHINNTHGFEFVSHDIVFKGICPECNK